jgi:hypothetical protein
MMTETKTSAEWIADAFDRVDREIEHEIKNLRRRQDAMARTVKLVRFVVELLEDVWGPATAQVHVSENGGAAAWYETGHTKIRVDIRPARVFFTEDAAGSNAWRDCVFADQGGGGFIRTETVRVPDLTETQAQEHFAKDLKEVRDRWARTSWIGYKLRGDA